MSSDGDFAAVGEARPLRWFSRLWTFVISLFFPGMGHGASWRIPERGRIRSSGDCHAAAIQSRV